MIRLRSPLGREWRRHDDAVLLTVEGDCHGATDGGITCVDDNVAHYLVNVIQPPAGLVCAPD